jgi:hypothetical protein
MHEIVDRIRGLIPGAPEQVPFTYGYAVAFPDCRFSGSLPASIAPDQVLDASKCSTLRQSIERIFDRFRRPGHYGQFATLLEVVNHYDSQFNLQLSDANKKDLIEYLKGI